MIKGYIRLFLHKNISCGYSLESPPLLKKPTCYCSLCVFCFTCDEPRQNMGRGLCVRKTVLSLSWFITDRSKAGLFLWFILIINVFDCVHFRIAGGHLLLLQYSYPLGFRSSCFYISCVCFSFPLGILGRLWNSIVSVPDLCLFIYFELVRYLKCRLQRNNTM